jgi:hypothetical protein
MTTAYRPDPVLLAAVVEQAELYIELHADAVIDEHAEGE